MVHTTRRFGTFVTVALVFVLAVVWAVSCARPIVLRVSRTPQDVYFLDAARGRLRLTNQRVTPASIGPNLVADGLTLHTITLRDAAGSVVATERDPYDFARDTRNPWWFDDGGGNFCLIRDQGRGNAALVDLRLAVFCVPLWFFMALVMMPVLLGRVVRGAIAARRARAGRCWSCGYDLRASPGRCPECGELPRRPRGPVTAAQPADAVDRAGR